MLYFFCFSKIKSLHSFLPTQENVMLFKVNQLPSFYRFSPSCSPVILPHIARSKQNYQEITVSSGTKPCILNCDWVVHPGVCEDVSWTKAVRESKCLSWISGQGFVPSLNEQMPLREKQHWWVDLGKREDVTGEFSYASSITWKVPPLVFPWHLSQQMTAFFLFFSLAHPARLYLGSEW